MKTEKKTRKRSPASMNSIVINNIRFTLLAKTVSLQGYKLVQIMSKYNDSSLSTNERQAFFVYKSFSEIGLWRLAAMEGMSFFKGIDYVQSSLIHLELQNFINERLSEVTFIDGLFEDIHKQTQSNQVIKMVPNVTLKTSINNAERIINISPFSDFAEASACGGILIKTEEEVQQERELKKVQNGQLDLPPTMISSKKDGFVSADREQKLITNDKLIELGKLVQKNYSVTDDKGDVARKHVYDLPDFFITTNHDLYGEKTGVYYNGITVKNAEIFKVSLTKTTSEQPKEETQPPELTFLDDLDLYYTESVLLNSTERKKSEFTDLLLKHSKGQTFFSDEAGNKSFDEEFLKLAESKSQDLTSSVLAEKSKSAKELMSLYKKYYKYELPKETKFCGTDKTHFMPFLLTTSDSVCTIFGLYSKYVPAGIYICKLFDHLDQCTPNEQRECMINNTNYAYIGDRYKNVFPFDVIEKLIKQRHNSICRSKKQTPGPGEGWASVKSSKHGGIRKTKKRRKLKN